MMNTTKQAQRIAKAQYNNYLLSSNYDLFDVYSSFSVYKTRAFERCKELMYQLNGYGLKIISANTNSFTVGFEYPDQETGVSMFAYITKDNDRACEL